MVLAFVYYVVDLMEKSCFVVHPLFGGRFVIVFSFSGNVFCSFSLAVVFVLSFFRFSFHTLWQRLCLGDQGEHVIHYLHGTVCHRFVNVFRTCFTRFS